MSMLNIERKISIVLTAFMICAVTADAQKAERSNVRDGNKQYKKDKFTEAEIAYRKSIEVNPRSTEGIYNLGNSLYKQEKFPEAAEQYQIIVGQGERLINEDVNNAGRLAHVFHNLGNISMKGQEYQKSIEAYKQSLRLNPTDEETRYNLALAQKLLKDQQQQQQDQQDQQQDQQKDQEQEQEQEKEQDQQQDQKQDQEQEQKTQEEQQQNEQMSRDNAQQMLDAFLQDEKDTQEKVKKAQMQQHQNRKKEKQW